MVWIGFEPGTPGQKANTITTEQKRILPNAVVRYRVQRISEFLFSCHFALVLQLDKEGCFTCPAQNFTRKDERMSGFFGL